MKRVSKYINGGTEKFNEKNVFDFDEKQELLIYKYVCGGKLECRDWKKIEGKYEFITYEEWHNYIFNKYKVYGKRQLTEFSRYLNNKIRKYSGLAIIGEGVVYPSLMSTFISFSLGVFTTGNLDNVLVYIATIIIVIGILYSIIKGTLKDAMEERDKHNMLVDYKAEIDELLRGV